MLADLRPDAVLSMYPGALEVAGMHSVLEQIVRERYAEAKVLDATVQRFRYRPGERLIVQYEVLVTHQGRRRTHWVTGRWRADAKRSRVDLFPKDRHLRSIGELLDGAKSGLTWLAPDGKRVHARSDEGLRAVRYRPGIGCTLKGEFRVAGQPEPVPMFIKVYASGTAARAFAKQRAVVRCAADVAACVPTPIGWCPQYEAVALPVVPGDDLSEPLQAEMLDRYATTVVEALSALHAVTDWGFGSRDAGSDLHRRATRLAAAVPGTSGLLERIVRRSTDLLVDAPTTALCHNDLKPEHVLVHAGRASFVDLDSAARGDPLRDIATLVERLHARPSGQVLAKALERAYFAQHPGRYHKGRYGAHRAAARVAMALHCLQHLAPEWRKEVPKLLLGAAGHVGVSYMNE